MSLPRTIQGARHTGLALTWSQEDGSTQDLTGATITGEIIDQDGNATAITGTLSLTSPAAGMFNWAFSAQDVATAGRFLVQFKANYGSLYDLSFPEEWIVEPAL